MNSNPLFDFSVNKENKAIHIKREFDATHELVWKAWTTAKLLDQWCAPKPYRTETKTLDFREGGFWHYAIVSSEGKDIGAGMITRKLNSKKSLRN
ncbi:SRPBCC domain-containing protein [Galbibacter pacificus]|uniref:SRPBCC domain-containing protein n=1 Tax=Galbibacter pacificus TaxID=2996052 RepID=A0ABT6FRI1_9FLAO|nr:SRPBCC domain-containing protein [Galbibacter pacificus]MDG3581815.1 SRPBCC domain-containing protein [Galbibacter pacificus]MDG3585711.1 SRPBCC domain-containing protein [Galbibacter pacificus]